MALAFLVAACSATDVDASGVTTVVSTTSTTFHGSTIPSAGTEREKAPDFTLVLADGDSFTLSETERPVYMLFWAEWCPVCRRELPIIDEVAADYADRIDFVAPAWRSVPESAEDAAAELMPSGAISWGLDNEEAIFGLYGVPYQPVTILIAADGTVFDQWAGVKRSEEIRDALDRLIDVSAGTESSGSQAVLRTGP